jgi:heme-degrading monooxygenase HmoA
VLTSPEAERRRAIAVVQRLEKETAEEGRHHERGERSLHQADRANHQGRTGSWNDFEKTYRATVATKGRQVPGLRGRWLLQDSEDKDTGFAVSLWESAAEMQAYEQSDLYRQEIAPALQPFFVGDYKTYRSEVKYTQ